MRATSVTVSRNKTRSDNKFENERIEITIAIPAGHTAAEGVAAGRAFIAEQFGEVPTPEEVAKATAVLDKAKKTVSL